MRSEFQQSVRRFSSRLPQRMPSDIESDTLRSELDFFSIRQTERFKRIDALLDEVGIVASGFAPKSPESTPLMAQYVYYLCLSCISILITLEFSYLHTLRESASDWIPMILSALVLDLIALLGLIFIVGNPNDWVSARPTFVSQVSFGVVTFVAFVSSFFILILARTAGALNDNKIDIKMMHNRKMGSEGSPSNGRRQLSPPHGRTVMTNFYKALISVAVMASFAGLVVTLGLLDEDQAMISFR